MAWFKKARKPIASPAKTSRVPEGLWVKCPECDTVIYTKDLIKNLHVCGKCAHHFRLNATDRLKILFDGALHVTDEGWRKLTWRWAFFFLALAVLNEIVWRTQTTDMWVKFKTFGFLPLTLLFALAQAPLMMKYESKDEGPGDEL